MVFGVLFLIPLFIALVIFIFGHRNITWPEFLLQIALQAIIAFTSSSIIYHSNTSDTLLLHGQVASKERVRVSCSHSYKCHCYESCSGSGENESCHKVCQTCYDHDYDVNWNVHSNIGYSSNIDRIDRQGLGEPPRWTIAEVGEPYSVRVSYENYIKGSPHSLFRSSGMKEKYKEKIVEYQGDTYDYYRTHRFMSRDVSFDDLDKKIVELNSIIGKKKEVSIGVVITKESREYFFALEESWIGGKKNDVIPVIGVNDQNEIIWVEVMAWAKDPIFKIKLRDDILGQKVIKVDELVSSIKLNTEEYYHRKPMSDFEYLKGSIVPSMTQWVWALVVGIILSLGLSFWLYSVDAFNPKRQYGL